MHASMSRLLTASGRRWLAISLAGLVAAVLTGTDYYDFSSSAVERICIASMLIGLIAAGYLGGAVVLLAFPLAYLASSLVERAFFWEGSSPGDSAFVTGDPLIAFLTVIPFALLLLGVGVVAGGHVARPRWMPDRQVTRGVAATLFTAILIAYWWWTAGGAAASTCDDVCSNGSEWWNDPDSPQWDDQLDLARWGMIAAAVTLVAYLVRWRWVSVALGVVTLVVFVKWYPVAAKGRFGPQLF